jgi:phosphopantothenoylcysteine decarboxylase/phosphopantothenate--cysteine ligase
MGFELAKEAYIRGANLTLVVAKVDIEISPIFDVIKVESSKEMNNVILDIISDFDIFIATAAVSDFAPINCEGSKISSSNPISLSFKPTVKIIQKIKEINPNIFLVGFKAEYGASKKEITDCARKQIEIAGTDLVIANDISKEDCHFGSDNNEVFLIDENILKVPLSSKKELSKIIFDEISKKI